MNLINISKKTLLHTNKQIISQNVWMGHVPFPISNTTDIHDYQQDQSTLKLDRWTFQNITLCMPASSFAQKFYRTQSEQKDTNRNKLSINTTWYIGVFCQPSI